MKFIILFFLHPNDFFQEIIEGKFRIQVLFIVLAYAALYIFSEVHFEPLEDSAYKALFYIENKYVAAFVSLAFELGFSVVLSFSIYFFILILNSSSKIMSIIVSVLSLKIIAILVIIFKILYFATLPFQFDIMFLSITGFILEMGYLFIAIKKALEVSNLKVLFIQCASVIIILLSGYTLVHTTRDGSYRELQKGKKLLAKFEFEKATRILSSAVEKDPTNAKIHYHLGEAYRQHVLFSRYKKLTLEGKRSLLSKAEIFYKKALSIDGMFHDARIGLARVYASEKRYEEAIKEFDIVIKQTPDRSMLYKEVSEIYLKLDKPELARKFLEFSLVGAERPGYDKKDYALISVDKIKMTTKKQINLESNIIWHIADPLFYHAIIDSERIAESRVLDVYESVLRTVILMKNYREVPRELGDEIKNEIIERCNDTILRRSFGIEIKDVKLRII